MRELKRLSVFLFFFLTACAFQGSQGDADTSTIEGYIVEVDPQTILVVSNITKEQALVESRDAVLRMEGINAIVFNVSSSTEYEKGQKVRVWADGSIRESFPAQAEAASVEVIKD